MSDFECCRTHLSRTLDGEIDLVVLSVCNYSISALACIARLIRHYHPSCSVLMDPGSTSIPLLRFYFNCLNARMGLVDFAQPLLALQGFIEQVMSGERGVSVGGIISSEPLSQRERNILQGIMREYKACDIARKLSLNIKTVSHYKRTGLRKLGARNIQDLLLPSTKHQWRGVVA
ncbi:hypothetical protein BSQ40_24265 [Serratia fonticola]|nr:hypothetical protein BSQ40_24265 [Serratia fonticola]